MGTPDLTVAHVVHLSRLIDDLVHCAKDEVAVLHLGHRPGPGHRRSNCSADDRVLRDRCIDDTVPAELLSETERDGEAAAEAARDADILA